MSDAIQVLSNTKQELIASFVQRELISKSVLADKVLDVSRFCVKGAKSIAFPKLTSYTVVDRDFGSAGASTNLTDSSDILLLDVNAYVATLIDASDVIQSTIEFKMESLASMAKAHAKYVDSKVIATLSAGYADYINATASAANITEANIIDMRAALVKNEADMNSLYLAVSADQEASLLKISNFVKSDAYGVSNIANGVIGRVYGFNVVVSTQLAAKTAYAFSTEGIVLGFQKGPAVTEQMANEYGANSVRIAMDQLFGTKAVQTARGTKLDLSTSVASGKSAFIFTLNQH
jgi:hypothetical protein